MSARAPPLDDFDAFVLSDAPSGTRAPTEQPSAHISEAADGYAVAELRATIEELRERLRNEEALTNELDEQNAQSLQELVRLKQEHVRELERVRAGASDGAGGGVSEALNSQLMNELEALRCDRESLAAAYERQLASMRGECDTLRAALAKCEQELRTQRTQLNAQVHSADLVMADAQELTRQNKAIRAQYDELKRAYDEVSSTLATLQRERDGLQRDATQGRTQAASLEDELRSLQFRFDEQSHYLADVLEERSHLLTASSDPSQELADMQRSLEVKENEVQELKTALREAELMARAEAASSADKDAELLSLRAQLEKAGSQESEEVAKLSAAESELRAVNSALQKRIEQLEALVDNLERRARESTSAAAPSPSASRGERNLQKTKTSLKTRDDEIDERVKELERALRAKDQAHETALAQAHSEATEVRQCLEASQAREQTLVRRLDELARGREGGDTEQLQRTVSQLTAEIERLKLYAQPGQHEKLATTVEVLGREKIDLEAQLASTRSLLERLLAERDEDVELHNALTVQAQQIQMLTKEKQDVQTLLFHKTEELEAAIVRADTAETQRDSLGSIGAAERLREAEQTIRELQTVIAELKRTVAELRGEDEEVVNEGDDIVSRESVSSPGRAQWLWQRLGYR